MSVGTRVHDHNLLDALEALDPQALSIDVWRVSRMGRDPTRGSTADGRWNAAGELEVLYTSRERNGALAEIGYRLGIEPIWPSRIQHEIHNIVAEFHNICDLSDFGLLNSLGLDESKFEGHDYRVEQAISAAAKFLGFDGILVPNARYRCENLILYTDVIDCGSLTLKSSEVVDWNAWRASNRSRPSRSRP